MVQITNVYRFVIHKIKANAYAHSSENDNVHLYLLTYPTIQAWFHTHNNLELQDQPTHGRVSALFEFAILDCGNLSAIDCQRNQILVVANGPEKIERGDELVRIVANHLLSRRGEDIIPCTGRNHGQLTRVMCARVG